MEEKGSDPDRNLHWHDIDGRRYLAGVWGYRFDGSHDGPPLRPHHTISREYNNLTFALCLYDSIYLGWNPSGSRAGAPPGACEEGTARGIRGVLRPVCCFSFSRVPRGFTLTNERVSGPGSNLHRPWHRRQRSTFWCSRSSVQPHRICDAPLSR